MRPRIAVCISGGGSNLQALLDAPELGGDIVLVVSNQANAGGLARAAKAGVLSVVLDHKGYASRAEFDAALDATLAEHSIDLVVLAGFMRILTPTFVERYAGRLLNIHPSLLPKYPGLHTHARALAAGDLEHGATVHFVTAELDGGPAILQARVPVSAGDDPEQLAARVLTVEHRIYPQVVRWWTAGRLRLVEGRARLDGRELPEAGLDWGALPEQTAVI